MCFYLFLVYIKDDIKFMLRVVEGEIAIGMLVLFLPPSHPVLF